MTRGAALTGALLITLATPATWPMALATFLLRGGLLLVVVPIVVVPSPVGLGNLLAPTLMAVVLGGRSIDVAWIAGATALALVAWVAIGGLVAASLEAAAARIVAGDENAAAHGRPDLPAARDATGTSGGATGVLVARLLAHVPTVLVLSWAAARLLESTYRELTSPLDVTTPIALRVLAGAPGVVVVSVVAWMLGESIGAIAARRIVLGGAGVLRALLDAVMAAALRPLTVLADFWLPTIALLLVLVPSALAAAAAWGMVRVALRSAGDLVTASLSVVVFVALWIVGLLLVGVTSAWRAAVWSVGHRGSA